jgi:cholesterol transport system auxiliary component
MKPTLALALLIAAASGAGCISVFPKEAPAQLFRFGVTPAASPARPAGSEARFGVLPAVAGFDREAASDRILTVTGNEAAYIKGSRWVTSAATLFDSAVANAFNADNGAARLIGRGEVARVDYLLKLDVRIFEARYDQGKGAAPTVVVEVHAALNRSSDRALAGDRLFQASVPASDNRVSAIATAFDQAVGKVLGDIVAWVDARGNV